MALVALHGKRRQRDRRLVIVPRAISTSRRMVKSAATASMEECDCGVAANGLGVPRAKK